MASPVRKSVQVFYDVISPYSWIGFEMMSRYKNKWNIDLQFRPFFLGGVMQGSDNKPPGYVPAKGAYMTDDIHRLRQYHQMPINHPSNPGETIFTVGSLSAMRFLTAVDMNRPDLTESVSRAVWMRVWSRDQDISQPPSLVEAGVEGGLSQSEAETLVSKMKDQTTKDRLKQVTQEALDHGAFGAPTFIIEDAGKTKHMVFGSDRIHIVAMLLGEKYEGPLNEYAKAKL